VLDTCVGLLAEFVSVVGVVAQYGLENAKNPPPSVTALESVERAEAAVVAAVPLSQHERVSLWKTMFTWPISVLDL
jgi:hypothetical protein